jgi:hypothetical protein
MAMHPRNGVVRYSACAALWLCAATAATASPDDCRVVANDVQRLACYDRLFPRAASDSVSASRPQAMAPVPAPTSNAMSDGTDRFGLTAAQQRAGGAVAAQTVDSISASVTNLQRISSGELVIFLDNGQVWQESEPESWVPPQKGDHVTIRRALLGSFMLVTADHVATRVRRVR